MSSDNISGIRIGVDIDNTMTNNIPYIINQGIDFCNEIGHSFDLDSTPRSPHPSALFGFNDDQSKEFERRYRRYNIIHIPPAKGIVEFMQSLDKKCHVTIVTGRKDTGVDEIGYPGEQLRQDTLDWLARYEIPYDDIAFGVTDKGKYCKEHNIQIMVDDNTNFINQCIDNSIFTIVMAHDYNKMYENDDRVVYVHNPDEAEEAIDNIITLFNSKAQEITESQNPIIKDSKFIPEIPRIGDKTFFVSDIHLGKPNLGCGEDYYKVINRRVTEDDTIIFVGDIGFKRDEFRIQKLTNFFTKIKCKHMFLVLGNHDIDSADLYYAMGFKGVYKKIITKKYVISHIPEKVPNGMINICGHIHGAGEYWNNVDPNKQINVFWKLINGPQRLETLLKMKKAGRFDGESKPSSKWKTPMPDGKILHLESTTETTDSTISNNLFFLSERNMNDSVLTPRIPTNFFTKNGYEDGSTKRVCFAPSIDKALMAISKRVKGMELYVHQPIGKPNIYKPSTDEVPDASITGEVWITQPIKVICIGKIRVIGDAGKDGHQFKYGNNKAELYDWDWEWIEKYHDTHINESLEFRLMEPFGSGEITLYHGSITCVDVIRPMSLNVGTKVSSPRSSSFWTADPHGAVLFAIEGLINKECKEMGIKRIPYAFDLKDMKMLIDKSRKSDFITITKKNPVFIYQKTMPTKYVGRGHNIGLHEYTLDIPVRPDRVQKVYFDDFDNIEFVDGALITEICEKHRTGKYDMYTSSFIEKLLYHSPSKTTELRKGVKSFLTESTALVNDEGNEVPKICPKCGAAVKVFFKGEPIYQCSNKDCGEYFGVVPFEESSTSGDEPFYFYHMVPKNIKGDKLLSPYAMNKLGYTDILSRSLDKYRDRLVDGWNIYPDKNRDDLTNDEILDGLEKFRGPKGSQMIYFFRYPPFKELGKNMKETLNGKDIYRININDPKVRSLIERIDWGHENSNTDDRALNKRYYQNITPDEYFSKYDDNKQPLFAPLNHISVVFKNGSIPLRYLEKVSSYKTHDTEKEYGESCKDRETARKFVSEVGKLAKKYDANYFIVTDGASGTSNKGNPAVKHARDSQIEWEKKHGFDPDEDWSNESAFTENVFFNKDDLEYNLDKFESGDSNVLLITGTSGSGKSTLGRSLASKYNAEYIEIDNADYESGFLCRDNIEIIKKHEVLLYECLMKDKKIYRKLMDNEKPTNDECADFIEKYIRYVLSYARKNKNKKFILEGIQIFDFEWMHDTFLSYPIIIKGTSALQSCLRRMKRDKIDIKQIPEQFKWIIPGEKSLNKFRALVNAANNVNESVFTESIIFPEKNLEINMDKWAPGTPLWITGTSGDGKSTLAMKMGKEYNALVIPLDILLCRLTRSKEWCQKKRLGLSKKEIESQPAYEYIDSHPELPYDMKENSLWLRNPEEYFNAFFEWILDITKNDRRFKYKRIIVEGCDVTFADPKFMSTQPLIIIGCSRFQSVLRRIKRDMTVDNHTLVDSIFREMKRNYIRGLNRNKDIFKKDILRYANESTLTSGDRKELDDEVFGIPSQRKYPLNDKDHVKAAIRMFNKVDKEHEKELAENIKRAMKKYKISTSIVGERNRLYKYI